MANSAVESMRVPPWVVVQTERAGEAMLKRAMTRDEALKEAWTSA